MNSYFISYEVVLIDGNINKPTKRGWLNVDATLEQIRDLEFTVNSIITNIKKYTDSKYKDIDLDLEKEEIIILNISKLN